MDHATIDPALKTWVASLTGVPVACVLWENEPRVQHNGQLGLLRWVSEAPLGLDAEAWEYDEDAVDTLAELTPSVHGDRRAVLQVDVETNDQRPGYDAQLLAQRVVDRCRAPSSRAALAALNVALAGVGPVLRTDYPFDDRMVARASVELTFNAVSHYEDTAGQTATIASVDIDATVIGAGGLEVADSISPGGTFNGPE